MVKPTIRRAGQGYSAGTWFQSTWFQSGCYGDGNHRFAPITVATFESAYRHLATLGNRFDLLIIDEVHHLGQQRQTGGTAVRAAPRGQSGIHEVLTKSKM